MSGDPTGASRKGVARQVGMAPCSVTIQHGMIQNFDGGCIEIGDHGRVAHKMLIACEGVALEIGDNGQVIGNLIVDARGQTLWMRASMLFRESQIDDTFQPASVTGGIASGTTLCGSKPCTPFPPLPKFHLTPFIVQGSQGLSRDRCADGFHFASLWEIADPIGLEHHTCRGVFAGTDQRQGPPSSGSRMREPGPAI